MIRKPAVAGQFYPSDPAELIKLINSFGTKDKTIVKEKAIACILPHAGYIYSGKVASEVLSSIEVAQTCLIIGPNHSGYGEPSSISRKGEWQTPLGNIKIDTALADELIKNSMYLVDDPVAHANEHSIEVELPLIQELSRKDFAFVPMVLAWAGDLVYKDIVESIVKSIKTLKKNVTIIASSDMTHYESQNSAAHKDEEAIKAILGLNEQGLLEIIERLSISMCGYIPTVITIMAAKKLGAKRASLISYQTSGDVTGDYSSVVGYAGIIIQ
ncbi:MAG: MEMO1 family protein [Candidatus Omnitrophota bacterium]